MKRLQHKRSYLMLMPALALAFGVSAHAAGDADKRAAGANTPVANAPAANTPAANPNTKRTQAARGMNLHQMRASELIGKNVTNPKGEGLGEIKDLVVDTTNGKVQYAVISFGGFLGLGDKLFAYPLEKFDRAADRGKLVLNVDKEKMKSAPGFEDKNWPNFNTDNYRRDVDRFYGSKAVGQNVRFARASSILNGDVKDRTNNDIGDIEDMVVSVPDGQVKYVILEFDRAWNPDNKLVAMPMKALRAEDRDGSDLVYIASKEELKGAPSFEKNRWPDLADDKFRGDVSRYEQTWVNSPAARTYPPHRGDRPVADRAERAVERAGDKVERAGDKVERATDRVVTPAPKQ